MDTSYKGLKLLDFVRVVDVVAGKDGFVQQINRASQNPVTPVVRVIIFSRNPCSVLFSSMLKSHVCS